MASIEEYHFNQASRMAYLSGQSQGATRLAMENFHGNFMASAGGPMGLLHRTQKFSVTSNDSLQFSTGAGETHTSNIITGIGMVISSITRGSTIEYPSTELSYSGSTTSTPEFHLRVNEVNASGGVRVFPPAPNDIHIPVIAGRYLHVPVYYTGLNNAISFYQPQAGDGFPTPTSGNAAEREGLFGSFPQGDDYYFVKDGNNCNPIIDSQRLLAQRHPVNPAGTSDGDGSGNDLNTDVGSQTDRQRFRQRSVSQHRRISLGFKVFNYGTGVLQTNIDVNFSTFDVYGMVFRFNRT